MIKIFSLAWRNILRNKRRTGITMLAIVAGMVALIVVGGYIEFSFWGLREATISSSLGHIQIYKKGYSEKGLTEPHKYLIDSHTFSKLAENLKRTPFVNYTAQKLSFSGLISAGGKALICMGTGVIPEQAEQLGEAAEVIEGEFLSDENSVVIGCELKKGLGAEIGDYLTILTTTIDGMINAMDLRLVGVIKTMSPEYNAVLVKLPLQAVQKLLGTDSVEKVFVFLTKTEFTDEVAMRLNSMFNEQKLDLELKKWDELATFYHAVVRLYTNIFSVLYAIIAVIVFLGIFNTMTMSVFERIREVGTLRAIGTKKIIIQTLFLCEGFLIGLIGGALGVATGVIVAKIINLCGGIYTPPPPGMAVGYSALILIVPNVLIRSYILSIIVSIVSSLYPAYRAARLNIVEALRHT